MDYISHISHIKGPINVPPPPANRHVKRVKRQRNERNEGRVGTFWGRWSDPPRTSARPSPGKLIATFCRWMLDMYNTYIYII